jgi:hypothetical protein
LIQPPRGGAAASAPLQHTAEFLRMQVENACAALTASFNMYLDSRTPGFSDVRLSNL